ncbi:MAG: PRC-barrel domain containing protein [Rhodobacteraceae bacterium]|nr:MAG: PRC-barrel domain containing protein [Paracoccaceae bacterium]
MKKLMISTALVALTGGIASAQDANTMFRAEADPMAIHASEFIGMRVYRAEASDSMGVDGLQDDWDDIGEINDVILTRDGDVDSVLVDIGGFLGMGENQVAVDMDQVKFVSDDSTADDDSDFFLVLNAPVADLENAPAYERAAMTTEMATDADAKEMEVAEKEGMAEADMNEPAVGYGAGMVEREGYMVAPRAELTAETLTGAAAYDSNDEWIGEVSDILLNDDGQVKSVIVDVGGFLGIGEKPVELELSEIDILRSEDGSETRVYISMTEEQLNALPSHES